ncbi:unnamed protein product [Parascedosporium putredinis]|uniref:WSC domain-containing protein n=1 Tax=Parascedosporium putredinis TaxID=1442378 RepID=A0A9P1H5P7_9PEZI|nr:unnamed protein product [Parascedosporium putredinis]CAI7998028.1 unnamed protein product [Parascedosporium putredinis]
MVHRMLLTVYHNPTIQGPETNPGVNGFASKDATRSVPYDEMTVARCTAACSGAGFTMAGLEYGGECSGNPGTGTSTPASSSSPAIPSVPGHLPIVVFGLEYGQECFCGNSFNSGSIAAPITDCNMPCAGNPFEFCGAGNRLSVYTRDLTSLPSVTGSTLSLSSTTMTTLSTSGCWVDGANGRILSHQVPDDPDMTRRSCVQACSNLGFAIAGAQYHTQCFAVISSQTEAFSRLTRRPLRMGVFSVEAPAALSPPAPQKTGLNGSWEYVGCARDNINNKRTFPWQLYFPGTLDANRCLAKCAEFGYMAGGLEYGEECYCGDPSDFFDGGSSFVDDAECNIVCAGNSKYLCGGGSRITTYFWKGDPLYEWSWPQTPPKPEATSS